MSEVLVVRADADARLGTGHVMRGFALAQAWKARGGEVVLASAAVPEPVAERFRDEGMEVVALDVAPFSERDQHATSALADRRGACALVLDGYGFDATYQARCRAPERIVAILDDNLENAPFAADLVLNQNLHAAELDYGARADHAALLLGTSYALLRREFVAAAPRAAKRSVHRILVTLGGADVTGATRAIVEDLTALATSYDIDVVLGPAAAAPPLAHPRVHVHRSVRDMVPLMHAADLAIAAAGSTCWELARMGVPMLLVVSADNQRRVARSLCDAGVALALAPEPGSGALHSLAAIVTPLLEDGERLVAMRARGLRLVDGQGAHRVAAALASAAHAHRSRRYAEVR